MWGPFSFDENTETIDVCVTCIRQVATHLGYGGPQNLEYLKYATHKIILDIIPHR